MAALRRAYLYLIAAASLTVFAAGAASIGQELLALTVSVGQAEQTRRLLVNGIAAAVVGVLVWAGHWIPTQLMANRPDERQSTLRGVYLMLVQAFAALAVALAAMRLIAAFLDRLAGFDSLWTSLLDPIPVIIVAGVIWAAHANVAATDRLNGEANGTAIARRWGMALVGFWALVVLLSGITSLFRVIWDGIFGNAAVSGDARLDGAIARTLVGLAIWLFHWRSNPARDAGTAARLTYLLASFSLCAAVALFQLSQVLFYGLSRLLGVDQPAGASGSLASLLGGPISVGVPFAIAWAYHTQALAREPLKNPGPRRAARMVVAFVALILIAVGVAGVLWILGDLLTGATFVDAIPWRERVSFYATLAIVGVPVWAVAWRPVVDDVEAATLSRRTYLYLALLGGVLACLGAGTTALYQFALVLLEMGSENPVRDLVRASAVLVTGLAVAAYHGRALRVEMAAAPQVTSEQAILTLTTPDGTILLKTSGDRTVLERAFSAARKNEPIE